MQMSHGYGDYEERTTSLKRRRDEDAANAFGRLEGGITTYSSHITHQQLNYGLSNDLG